MKLTQLIGVKKKSVKWIKVEAKTIKVTQNPGQFYGVVNILTWD